MNVETGEINTVLIQELLLLCSFVSLVRGKSAAESINLSKISKEMKYAEETMGIAPIVRLYKII